MIGAVVIGRNEERNLEACLRSLGHEIESIVYVDSGSTDRSVAIARSFGVEVVELDPSLPFSAARARNAGCSRLKIVFPAVNYVQFIDGDCEVVPEWIGKASKFLESYAEVGVVCGRRRERYPGRSIYNRLCDIEWDTPIGEASACGGDALVRLAAFDQVGGFRPDVIAGEEPELCVRLRASGWRRRRASVHGRIHSGFRTSHPHRRGPHRSKRPTMY